MNENYTNPQFQPQEEEMEIDIMELVKKAWDAKWNIIKWGCIGVVVGLILAFGIPKEYTSSMTIAPETQQRMGSGVSSIASMMGVSLDNSVDAIDVQMFPDVVASTPFLFNLLDLQVTFERKDSVITTDLLEYYKEYQRANWWSTIIGLPMKGLGAVISLLRPSDDEEETSGESQLDMYNLPKKVRGVVKGLSETILVNVDKKTGKTNISVTTQDRMVSKTLLDAVALELQLYMTNYRTSKSRQDVENLTVIYDQRKQDYYKAQQAYAKYADANKNVALQSAQAERERLQQEMNLAYQVYSQVATQLEAARIKEQEAKPVFAVVQPAVVPLQPSSTGKMKMMVMVGFLFGCVAVAWACFGKDYWADFRKKMTEK